jgi:hypothetical protein
MCRETVQGRAYRHTLRRTQAGDGFQYPLPVAVSRGAQKSALQLLIRSLE